MYFSYKLIAPRQTVRQTDRQTGKQTGMQTGRQTEIKTKHSPDSEQFSERQFPEIEQAEQFKQTALNSPKPTLLPLCLSLCLLSSLPICLLPACCMLHSLITVWQPLRTHSHMVTPSQVLLPLVLPKLVYLRVCIRQIKRHINMPYCQSCRLI